MSKLFKNLIKIMFVVTMVAVVAIAFVGCGSSSSSDTYYELRLSEQNSDISFTQGYVDLSSIVIEYYEMVPNVVENTVAETLMETLTIDSDSMVSTADMAKLDNTGTYTISVNYNFVILKVTITIIPEVVTSTYDVTFDAQGGVLDAYGTDITTLNLTSITAIPKVTKEGYNFGGWYPKSNGSGTILVTPYVLTSDTTYYAKWVNENIFTVTYVNQVTGEVISTVEVESGTELTYPTTATIEGKEFSYWGNYAGVLDTTEIVTESLVLYAYYETIECTVTITSEEWTSSVQFIVNYGESILSEYNAITFPNKTGYTGYWAVGSTSTAVTTTDLTSVKADLTITAYYKINSYTVTYMTPVDHTEQIGAEEFTEYTTKTGNYGAILGSTPVPSKTGYSTAIWMYLENGQYIDATEKLASGIEEDYTVYAIYTVDVYNIVFSDGSTQTTLQYEYGSYIESFTPTNSDGSEKYDLKYKTVEWYGNSNWESSSLASFPILVTAAKTYYIKVTDNPLQVDYTLPETVDGQELQYATAGLIKTEYVTSGTTTNNSLALELQMYDFVKWVNVDGDEVSTITDFYELSENNQLTAVLTVKLFNITFSNMTYEGADDTIVFEQISVLSDIKYDTILDASYFPTSGTDFVYPTYFDQEDNDEQDFVFDGWYIDTNFTKKVDFDTNTYVVMTDHITYYAKWVDTNKGTDGLQYSLVDNGSEPSYYMITGFEVGSTTSLDILYIPSEHNNIPVKGIATNAFVNAMLIEVREIRLTANIEYIESNAFTGLKSLSEISFVETYDDGTRYASSAYLAIVDNVLMSIDGKIIYLYPSGYLPVSLSYVVPSEVTTINGGAFALSQLYNVDFSECENLLEIGDYAFYSSVNLLKISSLPSSLTSVGEKAFYGCSSMHTITFGDSGSGLTYVGTNALANTAWWIEESKDNIVIFGGVLLMFADTTVTTYTIDAESGIVAIAEGAFNNGNYTLNITKVIITADSDLISIEAYAFIGCPLLKEIYIAKSGISFDEATFNGIQSYPTIYLESTVYDEYCNNTELVDFFGVDYIKSYTDET